MDLTVFARDGALQTLESLSNGICQLEKICNQTSLPQEIAELRLTELIENDLVKIDNQNFEENEYKMTERGKEAINIIQEIQKL